VAGVALAAAAEPITAVRLGASMVALQASIGALNDVIDAAADAGNKPGKPIPAGLVSADAGRAVVAVMAALGLGLAAPSGIALLALAGMVLAIGYGYDLVAKGTAWSWLPFALGIPLLPLYGWLGVTGAVPGWFTVLLPMAMLAGAALAIANARVDVERDIRAGRSSVAVQLGDRGSWWVGLGLLVAALVIAVVSLDRFGGRPGEWTFVGAGAAMALLGAAFGRRSSHAARERAWEFEAIGAAFVGLGWVLAVAH
jgi:4-hydroxybenzoate polyprenyltransferase